MPAWLAILVLAAALLWPALLNGAAPLLFPDSIDYLTNGRDGLLGVTRPPGYAYAILPFWRPLGLPAGLWAVAAAQAALSAWLVWLALRTALGKRGTAAGWWTLLAVPPLAAGSSAPFLASWIMADALSAPTLLAAALLAARWEGLRPGLRAALLLLMCIGAAAHQTHAAMAAAAGLAALGVGLLRPAALPGRRGALAVLAAATLSVLTVVGLNRAVHGHADTAQAGPSFLLARLVGDGLVARHVDALCAERQEAPLCRRRDWLADRKVDELLWEPASPLWVEYHGFEHMRADAQALVWGTLRLEWPTALGSGLRRAAGLLVSLRLPELDLRPMAEPMMSGLAHQFPELLAPAGASRQLSGELAAGIVPRVAPWAMLAGFGVLLAALPALLARGVPEGVLGIAVVAGMGANALVVGLTAEAYDRYQARLGWLPLLVLLCAVARWAVGGVAVTARFAAALPSVPGGAAPGRGGASRRG